VIFIRMDQGTISLQPIVFTRAFVSHGKPKEIDREYFGFIYNFERSILKWNWHALTTTNDEYKNDDMTHSGVAHAIRQLYFPHRLELSGKYLIEADCTLFGSLNTAVLTGDVEDKAFIALRTHLGYDNIRLPNAAKERAWKKFKAGVTYVIE
jgi:hypothetical protein